MAVKPGATKTVDKVADVIAAINELGKKQVMVGIPAENAGRREQGDPINNAEIGYIMEFGAPEANIPARPTLIPGIKGAQPEIAKILRTAGELAMNGKKEAALKALAAAGMKGRDAVKAKIGSNTPPPLAPSTLAARRRRGVTRENTLIDTDEFQGAVTYVIRNRKGTK